MWGGGKVKKTIIEGIIALGVLVGMVVGGLAYFATAEDLHLVEMRLDQKLVADAIMQVSQRIWQLEDRHRAEGPCANWEDERDKQEYRQLKLQLEQLKARQAQLIKQQGG